MVTTENQNYPLPDITRSVADEFYILMQQTLPMVDLDMHSLYQAVGEKSDKGHGHQMGAVEGLAQALEGKMPAGTTFLLSDLGDVLGMGDAPDGYVPVKIGESVVFQTALSALGDHGHSMAQVSGLGDALSSVASALEAKADSNSVVAKDGSGVMTGQLRVEANFAGLILRALVGSHPLIDFHAVGDAALSWRISMDTGINGNLTFYGRGGGLKAVLDQTGKLSLVGDRISLRGGNAGVLSDGANNIGFLDSSGDWVGRFDGAGRLWTKEFGDLNSRIESRASAYASGRVPTDAGWIGIGAFATLTQNSGGTRLGGDILAGSQLGGVGGTYRCMVTAVGNGSAGLFQRIA